MKTIGLLGGMSWESSLEYYRIINEETKRRLGGLHSAECLLWSFDFAEIEALQMAGDWDGAARRMVAAAQALERGGAHGIVICTNTMHKLAPQVQAAINIPILHIADTTARKICDDGLQTIGLLGTRFTMEQDFYKGRLIDNFGLKVIMPDDADREIIHDVIYDELCLGDVRDTSRAEYLRIMNDLTARGAQGVILGCTEITLLVKPEHTSIRLYDTTLLHALSAVDWALGEGEKPFEK
ncbi:MAG: aspartate/glutamate racemase family protein [Chloroflexi bacterium]|nr:aspartate/glutamate racemase family protein [Chloroflexota bacterium]